MRHKVVRRQLIPYNQSVKISELHGWRLSPAEAIEIQKSLSGKVSRCNETGAPTGSPPDNRPPDNGPLFIAGADISIKRFQKTATAAVVVLRYPEMSLADVSVIRDECTFPYVPGLLSFRESPLVLKACEKLNVEFDLLLVDGQGYAHPRRMGLACHLGLLLDKPTIGCAKSRLIGTHVEPSTAAGSRADLIDEGETIGTALRTKAGTKPIYVSIGHKVDLETAVKWTVACCRGYRIPEPLRLAHLAAGGNLKVPVSFRETL